MTDSDEQHEKSKHTICITHVWITVTVEADSPAEALELVQGGYWDMWSDGEIHYDDAEYESE